jgi:Fur family transcriptional regulator, stress-responsive regulator
MRSPEELTQVFRERGLKVTPQRQCIFRALHGSEVHPTAEWVHAAVIREMPTVSLRTVYQTLHDLAAMGEIQQIDLGTGAIRFDPTVVAHHHLVCEGCGKVRDLYADFGSVQVPEGDEAGFTITGAEVVFRGRCDACAATGPAGPTSSTQPTPPKEAQAHA